MRTIEEVHKIIQNTYGEPQYCTLCYNLLEKAVMPGRKIKTCQECKQECKRKKAKEYRDMRALLVN